MLGDIEFLISEVGNYNENVEYLGDIFKMFIYILIKFGKKGVKFIC